MASYTRVCGVCAFREFMEDRLTAVPCAICTKPVRLDECKINDLGEAVHDACYPEQLKEEILW